MPKALSNKDMNSLKIINQADGTSAGDGVNRGQLDANATADRSRANHTGSQTASTVSDFDTQVRTSTLNQMTAPTADLNINSNKLTSVTDGTVDSDGATWGQVKNLISGQRKTDVRLVSTTNLDLNGAETIDGVSTANGDRVLAVGQTAPAQNGIYVVAAGAWARSTDADVAGEFATHWLVNSTEGSVKGNHVYMHSTDGAVTLETTSLTFVDIGPISAGNGANGFSANSPVTSAGGTWTITHNLGTRDVLVSVRRNSSPWDQVEVSNEAATTNTVEVKPDVALTLDEFRATVIKVG
jgi:hypothetical protein